MRPSPLVLSFAVVSMFASARLDAQVTADSLLRGARERDRRGARVDLPLLDAPYDVAHGLRGPSMAQSLAVGELYVEASHSAIQRAWGAHRNLAGLSIAVFDMLTLPFSDAWVHEEFHRAVLGSHGIGSFDDVYRLNLAASEISVSHVKDEDLVRLKAQHPADQVRLGEAGIEGENQLVLHLEGQRFFAGSRSYNIPLYWYTKLNSLFYVASGAMAETDTLTDEMNAREGSDVARRDFTGHDFTAWAYDLHRPAEPYDARGVHPSGVGIDRYIRASDLTEEERDYLRREGRLQALNLLDPFLFGFGGITVHSPVSGGDLRLNATVSHYLTSFGHTVDVNLFARQDQANLLVTLHRYANGARGFAGVDAILIDLPVEVAGATVALSPRLALWTQPEAQEFRTTSSRFGGLASLRVHLPARNGLGTFVEVEGKSAGWVAGNVHLDRNVSVRVGASLRVGS